MAAKPLWVWLISKKNYDERHLGTRYLITNFGGFFFFLSSRFGTEIFFMVQKIFNRVVFPSDFSTKKNSSGISLETL